MVRNNCEWGFILRRFSKIYGFSEELIISFLKHVACIKVMYSFALNSFSIFVNIPFLRIHCVKEPRVSNLGMWHIKSFKNLFRRRIIILIILLLTRKVNWLTINFMVLLFLILFIILEIVYSLLQTSNIWQILDFRLFSWKLYRLFIFLLIVHDDHAGKQLRKGYTHKLLMVHSNIWKSLIKHIFLL